MQGSVFKDKNGRWRGVVELPKGPDGKRKQKTLYGKGIKGSSEQKRDTQRLVNELIYKLENNLYINASNATLEDYLREWLKTYAVTNLEETTRELYELYVNVHIVPAIGTLKIKNIKPIELQKFYNEKIESGLSSNSVGKLHVFLNRAFKDAYRNRIIEYNPCDGVEKPKKKRYTPNIYDEENFNKLLDLTKGTFDEICILLAGVCGLRRGEIFGLRLCDIDFKQSTLSIVETMVRLNKEWIIKAPKNETSQRKIKIPWFVSDAINNYLSSLKVVPERICAQYKPGSYSKRFKQLLSDNKLPHIRFHDLRHFNATIMLKYGVPDKVASERLGHSQVQTTREIYQHVLPNMDHQAAEIIEGIFVNKEAK